MSESQHTPGVSLNRTNLSSDLAALRTLPPSTASSLLSSPPSPSTTKPEMEATQSVTRDTNDRPDTRAILTGYTPSTATHEQSQTLVRAYIGQMGEMKVLQANGEGDGLGARIDVLRERGSEIADVLAEVQV